MVLVGGLLFYAILARWFGVDGVGAAALVKRGAGILAPIVFLGLQTGLPRMMPLASRDPGLLSGYFVAGAALLAGALLLAVLPLIMLPTVSASILLGNSHFGYLEVATTVTLASLVAYGMVRGMLFGLLRIPVASVLQVLGVGVAPILAILLWHPSVTGAMTAAGAATIVVALAGAPPFLGPAMRGLKHIAFDRGARGLLAYSVPRMPGDVAMATLISIGTLWAARFADLRTTGYLSVSQSLLSAITAAFVPLSVVLLPRAAALIASGRRDTISSRIAELASLTVLGSTFVAVQGAVFAGTLLFWWLGPSFTSGAGILQLTLLGVPFLALFFSLRGLVDAITSRPYHTYNLFIALAIGVAGFVLTMGLLPRSWTAYGIAASSSASLLVLAILTVRVTSRLYEAPFTPRLFLSPMLRNAAAGAVALAVHHYVVRGTDLAGLVEIAILELALATATFFPVLAVIRSNGDILRGGPGTEVRR